MKARASILIATLFLIHAAAPAASAGEAPKAGATGCPTVTAAKETIAAGDMRWQTFDFWVDRYRRGVARPAEDNDSSGVGQFCGSWLVVLRTPNNREPSGRFTLVVGPDGSYASVVRDGSSADSGSFRLDRGKLSATDGGLRFKSALGWDDQGLWLRRSDGVVVAMLQQQILEFQPLGSAAKLQFAGILQAADKAGSDLDSNFELARVLATSWAPDAELRALELAARADSASYTILTPSFYSPANNATLVMQFDFGLGQMPAGRMFAGNTSRTERAIDPATAAFPSEIVSGPPSGPAVLRWWGKDETARLWWVITRPAVRSGRDDICYDVADAAVRDCRMLFGDGVSMPRRKKGQARTQ